MDKKDKEVIRRLISDGFYLAENDPKSLSIILSNLDVLKARCEYDKLNENLKKDNVTEQRKEVAKEEAKR